MWNKAFVFIGILAAGYLLFQFHTGDIVTNDLFQYIIEDENVSESNISNDESGKIFGGIIPSAENTNLDDYFSELKENQNIDTFIVLARNRTNQGRFQVAMWKDDYKLEGDTLFTDTGFVDEILNKPVEASVGISFKPFEKETQIPALSPYLKKYFPNAKIVPVLIKEISDKKNLETFADILAEMNDDGIFVLASADFSQGMDEKTKNFHQELNENILKNFEKNSVIQMDVDGQKVIYTLMDFLEKTDAKNAEVDGSFVNFHEGDPADDDRDLTITAFGDMMLGRYVRVLMDEKGLGYIFEKISGNENNFFKGADYLFANLEGPIKGEGKKGGTAMVFSFNEDVAPFLKKYGFNILSITNNHALDAGWDGRDTTIAALDQAGVGWCGHPSEADPASVYYGKAGEKSVAFICFQDVTYSLNDTAALELIKSVRSNVDYLIVSIHWGNEYTHTPIYGSQIEPGHAFIDAGADFVIGHHPHVVESFEVYNGKFIFYSLGNFVFDQYWSSETQEELGLGIVLDDADESNDALKTKVYLFPMKSAASQPYLLTGEEYSKWIEEFISYGEYSDEMKEMIRNGVVEN